MSYKYMRGQKYTSRNANEKEKLTDAYLNREFEYDPDTDASYQDYAKMMAESGQKAMEDTVGKATALSGGYANSYASVAGQQVYNDYMRDAALAKEDFRDRAYQRYAQEGADIAEQIAMLDSREADDRAAWEADYAADIADATARDDTAALANIYGYESEKDFLDANRKKAGDAELSALKEAIKNGNGNEYLLRLSEMGYDVSDIYDDIKSWGLTGELKGVTIVENGIAEGVDGIEYDPEASLPYVSSSVVNDAIKNIRKPKEGENFQIARTNKDHKERNNWNVQLGSKVENEKITGDLGSALGIVLYDNKLYYVSPDGEVFTVKSRANLEDEYNKLLNYMKSLKEN